MTTWHNDDSLEEVVEFFLTCAFPLDLHVDECSWVAITVGDTALAKTAEEKVALAIRASMGGQETPILNDPGGGN